MLIVWIRKIALSAIIIGFFLPFLNTCTKQDRKDRDNHVQIVEKPSFAKPDGINYSGIGYIITDFSFDHLLIWLLIVSFLSAIFLLVVFSLNLPISNIHSFGIGLFGVSGLLLLYNIELFENLKYGFWICLLAYACYLFSFSGSIYRKYKRQKSAS